MIQLNNDYYLADTEKRSGVKKLRHINGKEYALKVKFCGPKEVAIYNEVVLSRIAKALGVRAIENKEARWRLRTGVLSDWFLKNGEIINLFSVTPTSSFLPDCFQEMNLRQSLKYYENYDLHKDFKKNLVEMYLHSVLCCNTDHRVSQDFVTRKILCRNIFTTTDVNGQVNMAPYHDMETSAHTNAETILHEYPKQSIDAGYKKNLDTLRTEHTEIHDKFLDEATRLDLETLCEHGKNEEHKAKMLSGIKSQIQMMKNF